MSKSSRVVGEAFASLTIFIRTEYDAGDKNWRQQTKRVEEKLLISEEALQKVATGKGEEAGVTASVSTKVSDAVYWGEGTWDKIPYTVEIFSSVSLKCDQDVEAIMTAHSMAYDMAWHASRAHIVKARNGHVLDIRDRLFPELFEGE